MIEREFIMSLLGLKSNLIIIDENVNLDPNDNSNNKLAYDSNPPSMIEELSEDDLKRKVIELDNQLKEYKRNIQIAMTALDLAIEDLKISNIDLELLEKKGNSTEWMIAKLHDDLMSYYLFKAEDKTQ